MRAWQAPGVGWCLLAAVLALATLTAQAAAPLRIDWQPGLATTQPWRWWSAAFVHYSALHLGANLLGTALVAAFGWRASVPGHITLAWTAAWPLTQLGLALQPSLLHYGGLSGVLHAGVAVVAVHLIARGPKRQRLLGGAVLLGLGLKLVSETPWLGAVQHPPGWDIGIAPFAHVSGTLAGVLCGAVAEGWHLRAKMRRG